MGIGDAAVFSGGVVARAQEMQGLMYPCKPIFLASVRSFFVNYPEIEVRDLNAVREEWNKGDSTGMIGPGTEFVLGKHSQTPRSMAMDMYDFIYQSLGLNYDDRWDKCPLPAAALQVTQRVLPGSDYIFVHDKPTHPLDKSRIDWRGPIVTADHRIHESILAWADILKYAKEIHVINSVMFWLAEHLPTTGKLFAHWYARPFLPIWQNYKVRKDWTWYLE